MTVIVEELTDRRDAHRDALADVYRAAFCVPPYDEPASAAQEFVDEQLPKHAQRDGFRLVGAFDDDRSLLGFAYGYTGERGQWWSDHVASVAPPDVVDAWVGGHFEFVELAVRADAQGRGIGGALHDALLAGLPHDRALLATYRDDRPAPRLYRRKGWRVLLDPLDDDSTLYGLDLRQR